MELKMGSAMEGRFVVVVILFFKKKLGSGQARPGHCGVKVLCV